MTSAKALTAMEKPLGCTKRAWISHTPPGSAKAWSRYDLVPALQWNRIGTMRAATWPVTRTQSMWKRRPSFSSTSLSLPGRAGSKRATKHNHSQTHTRTCTHKHTALFDSSVPGISRQRGLIARRSRPSTRPAASYLSLEFEECPTPLLPLPNLIPPSLPVPLIEQHRPRTSHPTQPLLYAHTG